MLDKNQMVPLNISLHLLFCNKCRQTIKMLKIAEKEIAEPLSMVSPVTDESIQKIMESVSEDVYKKIQKKSISFGSWIVTGLIMLFLLIVSIYTISLTNSRTLSIIYALLIAFCVTGYSATFVFGNIDVFVKKISGKAA